MYTNINTDINTDILYGFKGFKKGLIAHNNFKYEIGKTYETTDKIQLCKNGFHFCLIPSNVDKYYLPGPDIEYCLVGISKKDNIIHDIENGKSVTNRITIISMLTRNEMENIINKSMNGEFKSKTGNIYHYKESSLHNDNGPAVIKINHMNQFHYEWYVDGKLHSVNDMPAIIYTSGRKEWYRYGELHRENDLPAVEDDGFRSWYYNGSRHRENDMPAGECANGYKYWYYNGLKHRDNGKPAIIANENRYYEHGIEIFIEPTPGKETEYKNDKIKFNHPLNELLWTFKF